ncbi:MAG: efflux RND transporter periplasmic adaptor subunit [Bacteroidaceae bacterium]
MKKILRIALLVIVALIFLGTFVFLYQKSKPQKVVYEIVTPQISNLEKTTVATGKVEPRNEILIKPQISGIIEKLYYKEAGHTVKKGEILAKVMVIPELGTLNSAQNRVRLAIINGKQAETDFARTQKLYISKLISKEDYEKGEVTVKQAREETQNAKDALEIIKTGITKNSASFSSTLIRSTIDGLILDIPVKEGNSVIMSNTFNDGTTIASIANMNDLIFQGNVDETEVGRLHAGMPIKLTIGALQDMSFNAILEYISPQGVETNGANQFEIKAAINIPHSVTIRAGYSANAEIVLEKADKVLTVPESTVEFNGDSTFVYILTASKPEQKFERRQVYTGISDGIKVEIKKGITKKDKIRGAVIDKKNATAKDNDENE